MTLERYIRIIAGTFVLASLALGTWVNANWYWFTAFVGARYFFAKNLGGFAELGYGVSYLNLGLAYKF